MDTHWRLQATSLHPLQVVTPAASRLLWNTGFGVWRRRGRPALRFLGVGVERQRVGAAGGAAEKEAAGVVGGPERQQSVAADRPEEREENHRYTTAAC